METGDGEAGQRGRGTVMIVGWWARYFGVFQETPAAAAVLWRAHEEISAWDNSSLEKGIAEKGHATADIEDEAPEADDGEKRK